VIYFICGIMHPEVLQIVIERLLVDACFTHIYYLKRLAMLPNNQSVPQ